MSKKRFKAFVEGLTDDQIDNLACVGASIRDFGAELEAEFLKRRGKLLTAEERNENDGKPNVVANPTIDIEVPGVMCLMLQPCDENKKTLGNGYRNDVGLADKVKTGNVPPTLIAEILLDKQIGMLNGKVADKALTEVKNALTAGMTVKDGKFSFDKKAAPPLKHAVEVAEWMAELKTNFIGTTNGATHTSMEVIPIPLEPHSTPMEANTDTAEIPSPAGSPPTTELQVDNVSPVVVATGHPPSFIDTFGQVSE